MGDGSRSRRGRPIRLSGRGCSYSEKCSFMTAISSASSEEIAAQARRSTRIRAEVAIADNTHAEYTNILYKIPLITVTLECDAPDREAPHRANI